MKIDEKELNRLRKIGESMNVSKRTVKIWEKNLKQNYRFFQPNNAHTPTPRTEREAYGYKNYYEMKLHQHYMKETTKAYIAVAVTVAIALLVSVWY
jgi:hypothetical protein